MNLTEPLQGSGFKNINAMSENQGFQGEQAPKHGMDGWMDGLYLNSYKTIFHRAICVTLGSRFPVNLTGKGNVAVGNGLWLLQFLTAHQRLKLQLSLVCVCTVHECMYSRWVSYKHLKCQMSHFSGDSIDSEHSPVIKSMLELTNIIHIDCRYSPT